MTTSIGEANLNRLKAELSRLGAEDAHVSLDSEFDPKSGPLAKIQIGDPYWHLLVTDLQQLLESLPDEAGSEAIQKVIEQKATTVWHGPAPSGSRDTSF